MKKNEKIAIEVVTLQDIGYMLAENQADLTIRQKLFLNHAVPLVRDKQDKQSSGTNHASHSLKDRVRRKKQEISRGIEQ